MHYNRTSLLNPLKEFPCFILRQIDAAVRAASYINISAKLAAPGRIMKTDVSVKRHPVIHVCLILRLSVYDFPAQSTIGFFPV